MSDVLRVLTEARETIGPSERWTRNVAARAKSGRPIGPREANAVCWCADGAVMLASGEDRRLADLVRNALVAQAEDIFDLEDHIDVNDGLGHAAILKVFDAAIAAEQAKLASPSP